jgi:hypothetical protein
LHIDRSLIRLSSGVPQNDPQIKLLDISDLAQHIERMRRTCSDLDAAIGTAAFGVHRELLDRLKREADAVLRALLLEGLDRRKRTRPRKVAMNIPSERQAAVTSTCPHCNSPRTDTMESQKIVPRGTPSNADFFHCHECAHIWVVLKAPPRGWTAPDSPRS